MKNIDCNALFLEAMNSKGFEIFKYEWDHNEGEKNGQLKLFFLKIVNLNEQMGDANMDTNISYLFGARKFYVTNVKLPVTAS